MERWLILPVLSPAWQSHAEASSEKIPTTFRQCLDLPGSSLLHTDSVHPNSYTLFRLHLFLAASVSTQAVYSCQHLSYRNALPPNTKLSAFAKCMHSDLFRPKDVNLLLKIWLSGSGQNLLDQTSPLASSTIYMPGTLNYLHSPKIRQNFFLSSQIFITSISPTWKFLIQLTPSSLSKLGLQFI